MYVKSDWPVDLHQIFIILIVQLTEDIMDSILRHGGYFGEARNKLRSSDNFEKAIEETYPP